MNDTQQLGAKFHKDLGERIPRAEVAAIAAVVREALHAALAAEGVPAARLSDVAEATCCGSYVP